MARRQAKIFLSYASERKALAEPIALALRSRGYAVFFDRDDLLPGETYHDQIDRSIAAADIMIFGISPESVGKGRYTLTEIKLARRKWRTPQGHVLPVVLAPTPVDLIPTYLREVSFLEAEGNLVAEVAAEVGTLLEAIERRRRYGAGRKVRSALLIAAGTTTLAVGGLLVAPTAFDSLRTWLTAAEVTPEGPTASRQGPVESASLDSKAGTASLVDANDAGSIKTEPANPMDDLAWMEALEVTEFAAAISASREYLNKWPAGAHRDLAMARIREMQRDISVIQRLLNQLGSEVDIDGLPGEQTRDALYGLECPFGFAWDGQLSKGLIEKLDAFSRLPKPVEQKSTPSLIFFGHCEYELDADDEAQLRLFASSLQSGKSVYITGNAAQNEGSRELAIAFAARRAGVVAQFLETAGVSTSQMMTTSMGRDRPMFSGDDETSLSKNRNARLDKSL